MVDPSNQCDPSLPFVLHLLSSASLRLRGTIARESSVENNRITIDLDNKEMRVDDGATRFKLGGVIG